MLQSLQREQRAQRGQRADASIRHVVCRGQDREAALREVMRSYEPWQIVSAEPQLVGGVLGFFQHEALVITVDAAARPPSERSSSDPVETLLEETRDEVVLGGRVLARPTAPEDPFARPVAAEKSFSQVLGEVASSLGEEPGEYRPDAARVRRPERARLEDPDPPRVPTRARASCPTADVSARWTILCEMARSCGIPDALIPRELPENEHPQLRHVFARLPAPPPLPRTSGGLVAVVGSPLRGEGALSGLLETAGSVRPTAHAIARAVRCGVEDIALVCEGLPDRSVAPGLSACSPTEVASFAPGWRRDKVGVAAVYGPALGEDQRWTREVLKAMRPSSVVAVVSATTKPEDVERWVQAIGAADALALVDVRRTCTPGSILSLGIPVLSLDGEAATPSCWAGTCGARS